ncbi:MAG: hypothetical protein ACKO6C_06975 [Alphaproteobacteria bacterium]
MVKYARNSSGSSSPTLREGAGEKDLTQLNSLSRGGVRKLCKKAV